MDLLTIVILLFAAAAQLVYTITGKFIYFAWIALVAILMQGTYFFGPTILYLLLLTYIVSTTAELLSLKTPLYCFGVKYWYDLKHSFFASKIFLLGVYPLEVSIAWVILKYASFVVALLISAAFSLSWPVTAALTPLILVSLDFIIDPIAVRTSKLWRWQRGSKYFGIPIQNFIGWYVVGLVSTLLFGLAYRHQPITFHVLHLLPLVLYATFLGKIPQLMKLHKLFGFIGSLPAVIWTLLGIISLFILYLRGPA